MAGTFKPSTKYQDVDVYRSNTLSVTDLQTMRRTLAKRANQRMVRLERGKSLVTGESFNFGAIENARAYLGKRKRFSEKLELTTDLNQLRKEITVLQSFLNAKSSTIQGMREIERRRIKTFETGEWGQKWKQQGIRQKPIRFASTKEFYDFLNSGTFKNLIDAGFDSDQIVTMYQEAQTTAHLSDEEVRNQLEKAVEEYRAKGNANLKDLLSRLKLKPLR